MGCEWNARCTQNLKFGFFIMWYLDASQKGLETSMSTKLSDDSFILLTLPKLFLCARHFEDKEREAHSQVTTAHCEKE
jgi:hypothetical protein